ncbi:MAG TPA: electron transfer flavoprotein subunit alpha/FixB family protein [Promineifilum sp.]|nr:electron transfer flavoprotein subunit alpha/FixB family protein [Promineifilum sp.]
MSGGVWVFVESRDGAVSTISREAIGEARAVAGTLGAPLTGLVFGKDVADVVASAFDLGVDAVIASDDAVFENGRLEALGPQLVNLAKERQPDVIILGASTCGHGLAAWLGADLEAGVIADAIALSVDGGTVKATRSVYTGKLLCDTFVKGSPQIVTLRSRAFAQAESTGKTGTAEMVPAAVAEDAVPTKITGFESKAGKVSLTDASKIVSGGRGVGGPEGFAPLQELADVIGAAVGASQAAVDAGWISYDHQVGQTGKTVSPDLYIANGISGAIQHQAGMRTSKVIVAVNKDPDAPIFKLARYGIVGDLFQVVPALTAEFKKRLS